MLNKRRKYLFCRHFFMIVLLCFGFITGTAQVTKEQPYNRFQYHKFKWRTFHTEAFHVYFPYGNDSLGKFIVAELPEAIERVKHRMVTNLFETPNIIIYPSPDQLYESNIGMYEIEEKTLPTFVKTGNRIVLFYNGSYVDLKAQIYEAIVRSIWESQLKSDIAEQAKGANKSAIPFWFSEGAIRYFAHQWPVQAEDELRRSFENNNFQNWHEVIAYQPRLSGQAFCYYLTDQYYEQAVMQLFGQLKKKKDLRRSIRLIAKRELDSLYVLCFDYYNQRFSRQLQDSSQIQIETSAVPHKKGIIKTVLSDEDGKNVTYVLSRNNNRTVFNYNIPSGKTNKVSTYKLPPWINDYSKDQYPLVKNQGQNSLMVTQPIKGKLSVNQFSPLGGKYGQNNITGIDGVTNIQTTQSGQYLLSGYRKGQSDIVEYDANREKYSPYTSDRYDDGYLAMNTTNKVYFTTTRPMEATNDTVTPPIAQGIYTVNGKDVLGIVRDTLPYIVWDKPIVISGTELLATHTRYGTECFALVNTNNRAIQTLKEYQPIQYLQAQQQINTYRNNSDSIWITQEPFREWAKKNTSEDTNSRWLMDYRKRAAIRAKEDSLLMASKLNSITFLKDVLIPKGAKEQDEKRKDSTEASLLFNPKKVKPYILQLHSAYFSVKANNDYLINRYQPYLNYQGQFKFPEIGAMIQAGFTDLFENHHIGIGFRIPTATEGSDFFVNYRNTKKNLDWGLIYFRKVETVQPDAQRMWVNEEGLTYPGLAKVKTHYYELSLQYPITYYLSIGLDQAFRYDRTIFLATEKYSLVFDDIKSLWSITTLSLKQNKLRPTIPLLYRGYTAKLFIDGFKGFSQNGDALYGVNVKAEHHQPIYRYITLVTKAQAGHSGGGSNILYNVAGIDNNATVRVDSTVHFSQKAPYAFQSLITPFRGHLQNSLYGNQYAVFNVDLYFPLFQTLIPIETPLSFVNLLQLGLFSDVGTAKETWQKPQVSNGVLWSYGLSARSKLAGYPIRFDIAWPGTFSKKPVWYFSLSL